jgi:threonine synthase
LFGLESGIDYSPDKIEPSFPGIWRYKRSFALPEDAPMITLGEGDTPLIWCNIRGKEVGFKLESLNPTGSFKDRGTAVLVSWLVAAGITEAVEDSSGNAGASFAAYAARAGIKGRIYIPSYASGPKRAQIESYGADVISVPGPRSKAAEAVLQAVDGGMPYASHAFLPQGITGFATIAYELVQEMNELPGTILLPVGHGSLLLGIVKGFQAIKEKGIIQQIPMIIGIQAEVCAPLYQAYKQKSPTPVSTAEGKTIAEGVQIANPFHGQAVLQALRDNGGRILAVKEIEIKTGQEELAALGIHGELTSALIWNGLEQIYRDCPEPIICIITGHGLKSV